VREPGVARRVGVEFGAERLLVFDVLGALVDQRALVAVERSPVLVALDHVLMELGPEVFDHEAQVAQDRIIAKNAVVLLGHIPYSEQRQWPDGEPEQPPEPRPLRSRDREQQGQNDQGRHHKGSNLVDQGCVSPRMRA
jgi:hypothetical protein